MLFDIIDYQDAITEDLHRQGSWIIAYVKPSMAWPIRAQTVKYLNQDFLIIPITNDAYPAVAVRSVGANDGVLRERIMRFLSVLSWVKGSGISLVSFASGGNLHPLKYGSKRAGLTICEDFELNYIPEVTDSKAKLALALMREARSINHTAYSFLTFWRVLEVAVGQGRIKDWAREIIPHLTDHGVEKVLKEMEDSGITDIPEHLYGSGRCAVAHAGNDPIIDPDKLEDSWRLRSEMRLIQALAVRAIEDKLGVKTLSTILKEHLYELDGFKRIFGEDIVRIALNKEKIPENTNIDIPVIDIGLMNKQPFSALQGLLPTGIRYESGLITLFFQRADKRLQVEFILNFEQERLEFDISNAIFGIPDDGSATWAEIKADINDFRKWYFLNGRLSITDSETGELIARKDAFM